MFRRLMFFGIGVSALFVALAAPGPVHAQRSRGGFHPGPRMGMNRGFNPGFRSMPMPSFGSNPGFRSMSSFEFNPRFNGGFSDPRFSRGRFDRFEDRLEDRSRFGRFDRFEDRLEDRSRLGGFNSRFGGTFFDPRLGGMSFVPPFFMGF
jgi:hypothetical protein